MNNYNIKETYVVPKCEIIEMWQEGLLCNSTEASHDPYEEEFLNWNNL